MSTSEYSASSLADAAIDSLRDSGNPVGQVVRGNVEESGKTIVVASCYLSNKNLADDLAVEMGELIDRFILLEKEAA